MTGEQFRQFWFGLGLGIKRFLDFHSLFERNSANLSVNTSEIFGSVKVYSAFELLEYN